MADVVDALHEHNPLESGRREHVAVEPRQRVRAEQVLGVIVQDAVAADAGVHHAYRRSARARGETLRQPVRPALVAVDLRMIAVGDRVAERDECRRLSGGLDVDFVEEEA